VPYFAAALARGPAGWSGEEVDLKEVEDLDGVIDEMRRVEDDDSTDTLLLFVEENDEWFGIVRVDEDGDPRVFLSDGRAMESSELASLLGEAATVSEPVDDDGDEDDEADDEDDDDDAAQLSGDPVGDSDLLADLGTPAARLLELCAEEGQLPADVITALCESAGCLDTIDALRIS
jgi:putative tRNA adenosine deaminase-associated protein